MKTKAQVNKELYRQCAGSKLGSFLGSDDYSIDNKIAPVLEDMKPVGAWVRAWVYVSYDEISSEN